MGHVRRAVRLTLSARGLQGLVASMLGYAAVPPTPIQVGRDVVEVEIHLSRSPIELDPLVVRGRRYDPCSHRTTKILTSRGSEGNEDSATPMQGVPIHIPRASAGTDLRSSIGFP